VPVTGPKENRPSPGCRPLYWRGSGVTRCRTQHDVLRGERAGGRHCRGGLGENRATVRESGRCRRAKGIEASGRAHRVSGATESPTARRWWMLALLSICIAGNYYAYDSIAPVADLLRSGRGFSQSQIGLLNAVFSLPNIVLALAGGILIDRYGPAR